MQIFGGFLSSMLTRKTERRFCWSTILEYHNRLRNEVDGMKGAEKVPDPGLIKISVLTKVSLIGLANLWYKVSLGHFRPCRT